MHQPNPKTFYWIDYETFGLHTSLDRPCQFAGIRTDMDFNEIGEPLMIYCKPPRDYLPSAMACLITGITPQFALQNGLKEPEFIEQIHRELSATNTCTIGYNNISFDDEVTRHTLYRNFYDPYAWAYAQGNSRWDLLDVLRTFYALRPEGINWVYNEKGLPVFKLDQLAPANGIEHGDAHDALADVRVTIALAKRARQSNSRLFDYIFANRSKKSSNQLILKGGPLLHISGRFGAKRSNISVIFPIVRSPINSNEIICADLSMDPSPILELNADALRKRLFTKRADLPTGELPVGLISVYLNKCPILFPVNFIGNCAPRLELDLNLSNKHLSQLKNTADFRQVQERITEVFTDRRAFENSNVDQMLYDGFFENPDRRFLEGLTRTTAKELSPESYRGNDLRIPLLIQRYKARNYPEKLSKEEELTWMKHCSDYHLAHIPGYLNSIETLAKKHAANPNHMHILNELKKYALRVME